jgi:DNA-binding transcriptional ArsR family regulator
MTAGASEKTPPKSRKSQTKKTSTKRAATKAATTTKTTATKTSATRRTSSRKASTRETPQTKKAPTSAREAIDDRLVKAMSHPLRQRILEILNQRVSSPREVAEELGEKLGDVGYHFRQLREYGAIELVRTEQRRGAIKHFYRATTRGMLDEDQWQRLPASARRKIYGQTLDQIWKHVGKAARNGGFERTDAHVSWTTFDLDERGYKQMVKLIDRTMERALAIQADVVERRAAGKLVGEQVKTEVVLLHFLPEGEPKKAED